MTNLPNALEMAVLRSNKQGQYDLTDAVQRPNHFSRVLDNLREMYEVCITDNGTSPSSSKITVCIDGSVGGTHFFTFESLRYYDVVPPRNITRCSLMEYFIEKQGTDHVVKVERY